MHRVYDSVVIAFVLTRPYILKLCDAATNWANTNSFWLARSLAMVVHEETQNEFPPNFDELFSVFHERVMFSIVKIR